MGIIISYPVLKLSQILSDRNMENELQATLDEYERDVAEHKHASESEAPETVALSSS
eukprot:m.103605 g.103605  ORF g.103605 m.103605 type:complete len:57 (+) comp15226_c0_seq6:2231-2401(+)